MEGEMHVIVVSDDVFCRIVDGKQTRIINPIKCMDDNDEEELFLVNNMKNRIWGRDGYTCKFISEEDYSKFVYIKRIGEAKIMTLDEITQDMAKECGVIPEPDEGLDSKGNYYGRLDYWLGLYMEMCNKYGFEIGGEWYRTNKFWNVRFERFTV